MFVEEKRAYKARKRPQIFQFRAFSLVRVAIQHFFRKPGKINDLRAFKRQHYP
jgi:hypothetical protein